MKNKIHYVANKAVFVFFVICIISGFSALIHMAIQGQLEGPREINRNTITEKVLIAGTLGGLVAMLLRIMIAATFTDRNNNTTPTEKHVAHHNEEVEKISRALDDAQKVEQLTKELEQLNTTHKQELVKKDNELSAVKTERDKFKEVLAKQEEEWDGERVKFFHCSSWNDKERDKTEKVFNDWIRENAAETVKLIQSGDGSYMDITIMYKKRPKKVKYNKPTDNELPTSAAAT